MSAERFTLDTNVLVYAVDARDPRKQSLAAQIVRQSALADCPLALQSIGEFYIAATRKLKLAAADARERSLRLMTVFEIFPHSPNALRAALAESAAGRFGFWDAVLLASAAEAGCSVILSEDMRDGARFGSLRVCHPFAGAELSPSARELITS
jgi:predicted nucleic acid-binding protein